MKEDYLQYVWKFQLFNTLNLKSIEGESIEVSKVGIHNFNSGPDFLEARVTIGSVVWCGSVEIHVRSSEWNIHKHQFDANYNNVVLHVVFQHDKEVLNKNGVRIPVLEIADLLVEDHYENFKRLINSKSWIACSKQIKTVGDVLLHSWMDRLVINRMERKSNEIGKELEKTNGDWQEVTHRFLFRHFGMKVNGDAMFELARRISFRMINKESNVASLLFGQAGMLSGVCEDQYYQSLQKEFNYVKHKRELVPMEAANWKYSKLHPPNFPTIRIAQMEALYAKGLDLFELIRSKVSIERYNLEFAVEINKYWENHYLFAKESHNVRNRIGKGIINNVLINVVVPISFMYGKYIADDSFMEYALQLLRKVNKENNRIVKNWESLDVHVESAYDSQAVLELYNEFCFLKKCIQCRVGNQILRS